MQNANTIDVVKALWREGQFENVCLKNGRGTVSEISSRHFGRQAQVDAHDVGAPAGRDLGKAAHAATNIENEFSREILWTETSTPAECAFGTTALFSIELSLGVEMPLETEAARVVLGVHKAINTVDERIAPSALDALQSFAFFAQPALASQATENS